MAQQCPASVDVTDIQFKLQSKHKVFVDNGNLRDHVNLLACASNHGLLFVGNPNAPELHAFILPDVIYAKSKGQPTHLRTTKLLNIPNTIACNADGSMLAVNYTVQGYGVLEIYNVPSFAASDVKTSYSIRLPDENVYALHLLWNPVLPTVIGVVLSNGNFVLYTLKDGGAMEMRSIKNQQIQCGCWSPKGKQIVLGHPNGKLQQFKPDLTPVKSIICPPDVHPGPFDTIALHWLSTFQFVVSFLQHGEGAMPNIYIVNAPKGGVPVFINYNDVCYSGSEPRKQQISFMHIAQWNLLLVTSANGVEIGLLGTKDSTDQPQWVHYMLLDEARIEMPLTESSDETYPIGLALDTSPTHELTVGEKKLQTMPVIHVLSTNGHLLCFNFLNLTPNAINICSPPAPLNYAMAKFSKLDESSLTQSSASQNVEENSQNLTLPTIEAPPPAPAFNIQPPNTAISQNLSPFGAVAVGSNPLFAGGWEQKPQSLNFGPTASANSSQQRSVIAKPTAQTAPIGAVTAVTAKPTQSTEVFKPLYTVSPEFAPPPVHQQQQQQRQQPQSQQAKSQLLNLSETNSVIQQMIIMQIMAFEKEIKQLGQKSKLILNDDLSTMKTYSKRLISLQEIIEQANEREFVMDVQDLRHSLTESYEMLNECRSKLRMYKNPDEIGVKYLTLSDCISQRQLKGLQNYLTINQSMMKTLDQQMDAQWSYYQDMVRRNSKHHMRVPCLDGIYQQMTKLKNLITQQQTKLHYIKSVIKQKDLGCGSLLGNDWRKEGTQISKSDGGIVSLADSILSMSINNMTDANSNKLPQNKLNALRNFTNQQVKVTIIKPQRPNRVELTSEVILETKQLIKRKETKDKETIAASKAAEKAQQTPQEKSGIPTFKPMSSQLYRPQHTQTSDSQQHLLKSSIGSFAHLQNYTDPKDPNYQQSLQQHQQQQPAHNFSGGNLFGKSEATKGATGAPELPKFSSNTTIVKSGVVEVKPNTVASTNKPIQFSKPQVDEKSSADPPAINFSFAAKSDNAEVGKSAPSGIFSTAAAKGGFMGFGQQTSNANSLFNNPNIIVDCANNQKPFSFGNTFMDSGNGTKQAAMPTQSAGGIASPTPTVSSSSTTNMQTTIFNKKNDNPIFGTSAISFTATTTPITETSSGNIVKTAKDDANEKKETKDKPTTAQTPAATNASAAQSQGDADSLVLKSLNICKPTVKEAVKPKEGNVFSFNANNENNPQGAFQPMPDSKSSTITTTTTSATVATSASAVPSLFSGKGSTNSTPTFGTFSSTGLNIPTFGNTTLSSSTNVFAANTTNTATPTFGGTSAFSFSNSTLFKQVPPAFQSSSTSANTVATTTTTTTSGATSTAATTESPITTAVTSPTVITTSTTVSSANLVATPPTPSTIATTTTTTTGATVPTPTPSTSASTTIAPTVVSSVSASNATTSPFISTIAATKAPDEPSLFGSTGLPTPAASPNSSAPKAENVTQSQPVTNMPTFGSMSLGSAAPASGGNIFGNTSSGFGSPASGIFGGAATAAVPTSPTTGGSIFGNTAIKSANTPSPSIFGNAANPTENSAGSIFGNAVKSASTTENSGGSIFGGTPAKGAENVNIFGSPTSQNTTAAVGSGGSIFGQSALGQSSGGGNIFAGAANKSELTSSASGFSFVGSAFGSAAKNTVAPGASIFGGTAAATDSPQQQQTSNIFGSPSGFGGAGAAAATSPFSSFSQGGTSVASTGFGSPTQQPQTGGAFSRPVFGGAPTFGSPPAFGAQPSFGGAPTFGSPKGFGSFSTPSTSPFGGAPAAQGSNIFESLGSTDTGLSFGNLAQTTNNPPSAPKPMFGGSSFMNYRA